MADEKSIPVGEFERSEDSIVKFTDTPDQQLFDPRDPAHRAKIVELSRSKNFKKLLAPNPKHPLVYVFDTGIELGLTMVAGCDIAKGQIVCTYEGEKIRPDDAHNIVVAEKYVREKIAELISTLSDKPEEIKLSSKYQEALYKNALEYVAEFQSYLLEASQDNRKKPLKPVIISGVEENSIGHFVNHGANANVYMLLQKIDRRQPANVVFKATKPIPAGSMILLNYGGDYTFPKKEIKIPPSLDHRTGSNYLKKYKERYDFDKIFILSDQEKEWLNIPDVHALVMPKLYEQLRTKQGDSKKTQVPETDLISVELDSSLTVRDRQAHIPPLLVACMRGEDGIIRSLVAKEVDVFAETLQGINVLKIIDQLAAKDQAKKNITRLVKLIEPITDKMQLTITKKEFSYYVMRHINLSDQLRSALFKKYNLVENIKKKPTEKEILSKKEKKRLRACIKKSFEKQIRNLKQQAKVKPKILSLTLEEKRSRELETAIAVPVSAPMEIVASEPLLSPLPSMLTAMVGAESTMLSSEPLSDSPEAKPAKTLPSTMLTEEKSSELKIESLTSSTASHAVASFVPPVSLKSLRDKQLLEYSEPIVATPLTASSFLPIPALVLGSVRPSLLQPQRSVKKRTQGLTFFSDSPGKRHKQGDIRISRWSEQPEDFQYPDLFATQYSPVNVGDVMSGLAARSYSEGLKPQNMVYFPQKEEKTIERKLLTIQECSARELKQPKKLAKKLIETFYNPQLNKELLENWYNSIKKGSAKLPKGKRFSKKLNSLILTIIINSQNKKPEDARHFLSLNKNKNLFSILKKLKLEEFQGCEETLKAKKFLLLHVLTITENKEFLGKNLEIREKLQSIYLQASDNQAKKMGYKLGLRKAQKIKKDELKSSSVTKATAATTATTATIPGLPTASYGRFFPSNQVAAPKLSLEQAKESIFRLMSTNHAMVILMFGDVDELQRKLQGINGYDILLMWYQMQLNLLENSSYKGSEIFKAMTSLYKNIESDCQISLDPPATKFHSAQPMSVIKSG